MNSTQREETISMLTAAVENGVRQPDLQNVADRYIWNAYQIHAPITAVAGMCFEAERRAGTLA